MRFLPILFLCFLTGAAVAQTVPPVDLSELAPSQFADEELDLPYYLKHFHTVANSVVMTGPRRGFIDIPIWRQPEQLAPHNARIMENVLSLAFFYATDRPWNPYYGHPAVRARLEAALDYWVEMQSPEGLFSGTGPNEWGTSPTAFATKFMGETLRLLDEGPPVDNELLDDVLEADRKAIRALLSSEEFFERGTRYSNQYTNIWGGTLAYLSLRPDAELEELLTSRLRQGLESFQSPAGFFYERRGADWVYELETHHSNHLSAWHYLRDTPLENDYADAIRRSHEWLAYNAVLEPDASGFTLNHSMETRRTFTFYEENRETTFGRTCLSVAEKVAVARAFCESQEERDDRKERDRNELERAWPEVPPLRVGEFYGYSPYAFLHRNHVQWHPSDEQKQSARTILPYLRSTRFTHRLADDRADFSVTFIRRPAYYAAFSAGDRMDKDQRYGLGLVWTPDYGAVLQSQKVDGTTWGTKAEGDDAVYEAILRDVRYAVDGGRPSLESGFTDLDGGTVSVSYLLGSSGDKIITFLDDEIVVRIRHEGSFVETIPVLLAPGDEVDVRDADMSIGPDLSLSFSPSGTPSTRMTNRRIGRKRVAAIEIRGRDELEYRFRF